MQVSYSNRSIIRVSRIASGLFAALCISACSGDTSNNGQGNTLPVAYSDFAVTFAHAYCSSIGACCAQANYNTSTCESSLTAQMNAALTTIAADPHIAYDANMGARLIDAISAVNTACTDRALSASMNIDFNEVFRGTVELGGSCGQSDDCAKPDAGYVMCNAGVCELDTMAPEGPRVTAGQPCNATCSGTTSAYGCSGMGSTAGTPSTPGECWVQDGLYCNNGTCTAAPPVGQACASSMYCQENGHCENGVCVADTATGPCSNDDSCLTGSYCDFTNTKVCTPLKANGATCNSDTECAGGQCEQDRCRVWTVATAASCAGLLD